MKKYLPTLISVSCVFLLSACGAFPGGSLESVESILSNSAGSAEADSAALAPQVEAVVVQTPLPGTAIPQFVDPLPVLSVAGGTIDTIV